MLDSWYRTRVSYLFCQSFAQLNKLSTHADLYNRSRKARARLIGPVCIFLCQSWHRTPLFTGRACVCMRETETGRECCMCASLALSQTALLTTRNSLTGVDAEPRPFSWLQQRLNEASAGQKRELQPAASEAAFFFFLPFIIIIIILSTYCDLLLPCDVVCIMHSCLQMVYSGIFV